MMPYYNDFRQQQNQQFFNNSLEVNYYRILGVDNDASAGDIMRAYRIKALEWHPDRHIGKETQSTAVAMFQKINEAHNVLIDPSMRRAYDNFLEAGNNTSGTFNFDELPEFSLEEVFQQCFSTNADPSTLPSFW